MEKKKKINLIDKKIQDNINEFEILDKKIEGNNKILNFIKKSGLLKKKNFFRYTNIIAIAISIFVLNAISTVELLDIAALSLISSGICFFGCEKLIGDKKSKSILKLKYDTNKASEIEDKEDDIIIENELLNAKKEINNSLISPVAYYGNALNMNLPNEELVELINQSHLNEKKYFDLLKTNIVKKYLMENNRYASDKKYFIFTKAVEFLAGAVALPFLVLGTYNLIGISSSPLLSIVTYLFFAFLSGSICLKEYKREEEKYKKRNIIISTEDENNDYDVIIDELKKKIVLEKKQEMNYINTLQKRLDGEIDTPVKVCKKENIINLEREVDDRITYYDSEKKQKKANVIQFKKR